MSVAYGIIFIISLLLPVGFFAFLKKKQCSYWFLFLFICVSVAELGYLLLSVSNTVNFALGANKITYLGQVFVPLCMFMIISGLCGVEYKKWVSYALIVCALLMFFLVLTTGHTDWYYRSVELIEADGAAKLIKTYGPLHPINLIYVLAYFAAMLAVIGVSIKRSTSKKLVGLMLAVVIGNIGMWIVEKLVTWNFEFLSVSYVMSEFVFFFVYWMLQDYIHVKDVPVQSSHEERSSVIFVDSKVRAERVDRILASLPEGVALSPRQIDVLEGILGGKSRKELAADLHISENTVKMHTTALFKALKVSSREEIYAMLRAQQGDSEQ